MSGQQPSRRKTHVATEPPPFERIALILQGGGALGAYQAGVYQALAEANLHPDWVAGISIGAVNSALIAGNPPERCVDRLREFWQTVSTSPFGVPYFAALEIHDEFTRSVVNQVRSLGILFGGAPGFFQPRVPPPFFYPSGSPEGLSYYDVAPLKATLERLVDFNLINDGAMRFSVGAANVRSGNFVYFDSITCQIGPEHVMASGSLPPRFRRPRLKASTTGTVVSSPTRRCNRCWTPDRERTPSRSSSICGAPAATFHAICSRARRAKRTFGFPAAPGWRRITLRKNKSSAARPPNF